MTDFGPIKDLILFAVAVATFFIGRMTGAKTEGREMGEIKTSLNCVKETIERVEKSLNNGITVLNSKVDTLEKDMAEVKASAKSAHKRIDEIINKG